MTSRNTLSLLGLAALGITVVVAPAQQKDNAAKGKSGMMSGSQMMGQMMTHHQGMSELMNKMTQSMTAINNEKDPAKLKALLAEHAALMDQMRTKMMGEGTMMQNISGQMGNCQMMGETGKTASK